MNLGSLSETIHFGMTNILTTCYKNRSTALGAGMLSCTGISITRLVALSTTVMMLLNEQQAVPVATKALMGTGYDPKPSYTWGTLPCMHPRVLS